MFCSNCGAAIPDHSTTCMACGAIQPVTEVPIEPAPKQSGVDRWALKMRGAEKTLNLVYIFRYVGMILSVIILGFTMLYMYGVMTGVEKIDYGFGTFYAATEKLEGITEVYKTAMLIIAVVGCIDAICLMVAYNRMQRYDSRFEQVFKLALLSIFTSLATIYWTGTGWLYFYLADLAVSALYAYHFYGAMADITLPLDKSLASKWDSLFKFYMGYLVAATLADVVVLMMKSDFNSLKVVEIFLTIILAGGVAILIYEIGFLKKSIGKVAELSRRTEAEQMDR